MSSDDHERCQRLLFEHHRRRQKVACALLRRLLSRHLDRPAEQLNWCKAEHGKPYLVDGACTFNLTHSEEIAALAVGSQELGLDVEDRRRRVDFLALGRRFFAPPEADELEKAADPRRLFFEIWTAKEAYIKALGDGLSHPLDQFLTYHQGRWGLFDLQGQPLNWFLSRPDCPYPEVSVGLAVAGPVQVRSYEFTPAGTVLPVPVA
ncbi:MAG: 4'-phosphopantetheinyl transferase superfamily protein [Vulcanimicrobiota bacterium]